MEIHFPSFLQLLEWGLDEKWSIPVIKCNLRIMRQKKGSLELTQFFHAVFLLTTCAEFTSCISIFSFSLLYNTWLLCCIEFKRLVSWLDYLILEQSMNASIYASLKENCLYEKFWNVKGKGNVILCTLGSPTWHTLNISNHLIFIHHFILFSGSTLDFGGGGGWCCWRRWCACLFFLSCVGAYKHKDNL